MVFSCWLCGLLIWGNPCTAKALHPQKLTAQRGPWPTKKRPAGCVNLGGMIYMEKSRKPFSSKPCENALRLSAFFGILSSAQGWNMEQYTCRRKHRTRERRQGGWLHGPNSLGGNSASSIHFELRPMWCAGQRAMLVKPKTTIFSWPFSARAS